MKHFRQSLFLKLSLLFLILLSVFGAIQLTFALRSALAFTRETDQKLNYTLANDLAQHFAPHLGMYLDIPKIENQFKDLMVMNPRVELYLLDETGRLTAYFAPEEKIKRMEVSMDPIHAFLENQPLPVLGDDPRGIDKQKPFSVTPVQIGDQTGYLYVILGGEQYDSISGIVAQSSIVRTVTMTLVGMLVITAVIGIILLFKVTKRLRAMTSTIQQFESGDTQVRIQDASNDEIGRLGRTFNTMSETIVTDMEKLEETDRLRRELIANISHDLRSPLASVKGYIETMQIKDNTITKKRRMELLDTIHKNVDGLSTLVEQLFELSKLDSKQVEPHKEPFSITELAQDVVLKFQPIAKEKKIHLSASHIQDIPLLKGDIGMIERAMSNLIENAVRYTPEDGAVLVDVKRDNLSIDVNISDTGQGIPQEDIPHIFDRFYRAEKSRSRTSGGSGLGLAISQAIMEAHGSKIKVKSKVNIGTTYKTQISN
jgi:signal transduction histidine kinase